MTWSISCEDLRGAFPLKLEKETTHGIV